MVFVNTVAGIVHFATNKYSGAVNKNIGDAFLLVWRVADAAESTAEATMSSESTSGPVRSIPSVASVDSNEPPKAHQMNSALFAFLKIIVDIENSNRSGVLRRYSRLPEVRKALGKEFSVQMGFGLHFGWAIEGNGKRGGRVRVVCWLCRLVVRGAAACCLLLLVDLFVTCG